MLSSDEFEYEPSIGNGKETLALIFEVVLSLDLREGSRVIRFSCCTNLSFLALSCL